MLSQVGVGQCVIGIQLQRDLKMLGALIFNEVAVRSPVFE